jgi:hypothetical protein
MKGYIFVAHNEEEIVKFYQGKISCDILEKYLIVEDRDYKYYEAKLFDFISGK